MKLAPGEPIDKHIVDGEEEVIVGTYEDDILNDENKEYDDIVEELSLILFCENENKSEKDGNDSKDDIEVIDVIENKNQNMAPKKTQQINYRLRPQKGQFEPIIDSLEMDCESFDDEFTDGLCFDCEEDILSESQWKESLDRRKEYMKYSKSVTSSKNIKFLPEAEVTEAVGVITSIVSETTRIVTIPAPSRVNTRVRQQPNTIQSVRTPISSFTNPQRAQTPTFTPQTAAPNRMPFTIIPVSTSSGVVNPLIISPPTFANTTIGPNLKLILQSGGVNQPTYVMLPRSSVANGLQNIMITSANTTSMGFQSLATALQSPSRPRIITPTAPRSMPPNAVQFIRPPTVVTPTVRPIVTIGANQTIRIQNYSNINQSNVNRNASNNSLFDCLTVFKGTQNASKMINMRNVLTIKPLPFSWPSNIDALINSLIKLGII